MASQATTTTALNPLNLWKVSYLLNSGNSGWSLTWYFAQSANIDQYTVERNAFRQFWAYYLGAFFCTTVQIAGCRYSAVGKPNLGRLIPATDFGTPQGFAVGQEAYPSLGWYYQMKDTSGQYRRLFWSRGCPKNWTGNWSPTNPVSPPQPDDMKQAVSQLQLALNNGDPIIAPIGQFCMLAWAKESPPRVVDVPNNIRLAPDNYHFQCGFNTITPAIGSTVQISRVTGGGTLGINGFNTITGITPAAAPLPTLYTLSHTTKCGTSVVIVKPGKAIQSAYQAYPILTVSPLRISTKKVGRPWFPTHGKPYRKRC